MNHNRFCGAFESQVARMETKEGIAITSLLLEITKRLHVRTQEWTNELIFHASSNLTILIEKYLGSNRGEAAL